MAQSRIQRDANGFFPSVPHPRTTNQKTKMVSKNSGTTQICIMRKISFFVCSRCGTIQRANAFQFGLF